MMDDEGAGKGRGGDGKELRGVGGVECFLDNVIVWGVDSSPKRTCIINF